MKTPFKLLFTFLFCFIFTQISAQTDYVELVIPTELKDNPKAVEYLENDAKRLNKMFQSVEKLGNDLEDIMVYASQIDTNDLSKREEHRAILMSKLESLSSSFLSVNFQILLYMGKDVFADKESMPQIFYKLEEKDGAAFKKSMKHIKVKKDLLKERANAFMERMGALTPDR